MGSCTNCNKPSLFQQAMNIAEGVSNLVFTDPKIEAIAKPRLNICSSCPFIVELVKIGNKRVCRCSKCNCLIDAKTRVESETCPINKW